MCGRFTQTDKALPGLEIVAEKPEEARECARYNGAPSQDFRVIRRHPKTGRYHGDRLVWGLIPHWVKTADGGRKPINAKSETVSQLPSFQSAYAARRCIVPIDNFFEWRKTTPPKQPFAIGMKDGSAFGLAGLWENWRHPETGEYLRTFCILTCPANELIATIHDRMPVILPPEAYHRWLSPMEADPRDLLVPFPPEKIRMWPISARVNSPRNDDPDILTPLE
jgi:putative SOS response-associated peptidase YedK